MSKKMSQTQMVAALKRKTEAENKAVIAQENAKLFTASVVNDLDVLNDRRQQWEATDYKKANEGLYALLGDTLGVYYVRFVNASKEDQKALRSALVYRLKANNIRVVKTSLTLTMLVRYVFNSDRNRAHSYSTVLLAAAAKKVEVANFAAWVAEKGGIEQVKREMVKKPEAVARNEAVKVATVDVHAEIKHNELKPIGHVDIAGLSGNYAVLLVKPNVGGGADIVGTFSEVNDAVVNALVVRLAKQQVDKANADKELGKQIDNELGGASDLLDADDEIADQRKVANA